MKAIDLGQNWNGTRSVIHLGESELVVKDVQDVSPIIANNERMRAHNGKRMGKNGYLAAEIPVTVLYEWKKDWRRNHSDKWAWKTYLAQKLNSRDYLKFRTTDTRI